MSATGADFDVTDEAILAGFAQRVGQVDGQLPRLQAWRPERIGSGQLHVVHGRTARRRPAGRDRGAARVALAPGRRWHAESLAIAIAGVVIVAFLAGRSVGEPSRPGGIGSAGSLPAGPGVRGGTELPGSGTPVESAVPASARPVATPAPSLDDPPLPTELPDGGRLAPIDGDGLRTAMATAGWPCGVLVRVGWDPIPEGLLAKLEAAGRLDSVTLSRAVGPVWIGSDIDGAGRGFKGRPLAMDPSGSIWVLRPGRSGASGGSIIQLDRLRSPGGTLIWRSTNVVWPVGCDQSTLDVKTLLTGMAPSDWPAGTVRDVSVVGSPVRTVRPSRAS